MSDLQAALSHLDSIINDEYPKLNMPGLAFALTDRQQLLQQTCYGLANLESRTPVEHSTLFEIGSISKSFACIIALQLREQGLLDFHAPLTEYLPWFRVQTCYEAITLHHLMSHSAGLIMGPDVLPDAMYAAYALRHTEVGAAPGEFFHYSNDGYKLVGLVLQAVTGQRLPQLIEERIFRPLGMAGSTATITHQVREQLAQGYEAWYDDRPLPSGGKLAPATWLESETADGSICSTTADMCRYLRVLMNGGAPLLSPESFALMRAPHVATGDELHGEHYGYGLFTEEIDGQSCIGHSGGMVGYRAFMFTDLDSGFGVVTLVNGPGDSEALARYSLACLRAAQNGQALPPAAATQPFTIANAGEYAGEYNNGDSKLVFVEYKEGLGLDYGGEILPLERLGEDKLYTQHPDFALFPFSFQRRQGQLNAVAHGAGLFTRQGQTPAPEAAHPPRWLAYIGHYRSNNPWQTNFRLVLRRGALLLVYPGGDEEPLTELEEGFFRVGSDGRSPERLRFGPLIDGKAISATLSGCEFGRAFTP